MIVRTSQTHYLGTILSSLKNIGGCVTILFLLIQFPLNAQIQVYPVSLTTQLTPPYSVNLADYVAPGSEQLKLIIVQRDLTQAPYMLFLKMEIILNGRVIIRTSPLYIPPPLTLDPGIPTVISGSDLYPFFDPANMEFVVEDIRETYLRTRILPEGAYVISFTAYDFTRRDVALSNGGSMFCYLAKTDPPILNFPLNNTGVLSSPSQFINFQWLSRSTSSPNSALSTQYRLDLFEIRLDGRTPAEIVQSTRPFFTVGTDRTTYVYSINDPVLEAGLRYAWRIRAFDTEGRDYIRNDGYSEVFSFVYGVAENTALPSDNVENFSATALSPRKAKLKWDASPDFDSYKVLYRKQGGDARWYEEETILNTFELNGLSPGNIYDCRVQGKKNAIWGGFSDTDTVWLPIPEVIVCGSQFQTVAISNREPINTLMRMQEIEAGGFMVTIIDALNVNGVPGRFTGKGFVQVPLFAHKKIRCEFTNIFVNTDYQLVEGTIRLMTDKSEGGDNAMWDLDEISEGGSNNGKVISGTEGVTITLPEVVISGAGAISLDTAKKEILIQTQTGDVIRTDISQQLNEKAKTITIKDSEGNIYSVDTQSGKATSIGKAPTVSTPQQTSFPSSLSSGKAIVYFETIPGETKYSLDKRDKQYSRSSLFTEEYKTIPMTDGTLYDVPFKLIPVGETDVVLVKTEIKDKAIKADSIVFQSGTGTQYSSKPAGTKGQFILTLPSGKENDGIDIFALYPHQGGQPYLLGKLTVISYAIVRPKVVLVPVNGNDLDAGKVKEELDKVYLSLAVDWQVSTDKSNFSAPADSLDVTGSGLFSQYTPGMKKLNSAFIAHKGKDYDPAALYLFIMITSDDKNATGDMPRSKQFGYLFKKTALLGGEEALYRTIAHELSHGTFNLNHTFDSQYQITRSTTDNLMDYTGGTDLVKHQWDAIHDPGLVLGMFERDEEGAMSLPCLGWFDDCNNVLQMLDKIRNARINGKNITLKGQKNTEEYTLVANSVKIGETDYKKIRLIYKPEKEDYSFDPTKYDSYNQQFLVANGSVDEQSGFVYYKGTTPLFKIVVDDDTSKIGKLKEYLYGKGGSYESLSKLFNDKSVLTPSEIKDVREQIESLKNEEQKKELYLNLQEKVPYHNQRNNNAIVSEEDEGKVAIEWDKNGKPVSYRDYTSQEVSDRMCNLTSESMCLEYLGISCPNPNLQFENYLEQVRVNNDYGLRTAPLTRQQVAKKVGACYEYKGLMGTFYDNKEKIKEILLPKLKLGYSIMLSVWPECKGHLVRLQNITEDGILVDDPYGKVTNFILRQNCQSGGYDSNSKTEENSIGKANLWKWSDIESITVKYAEIYFKCN